MGLLPELGFVVNPTVQQMEDSSLDLIMAGTDGAVLMIEGYCDFLTEDQMLEVCFGCLIISPAAVHSTVVTPGYLVFFTPCSLPCQ